MHRRRCGSSKAMQLLISFTPEATEPKCYDRPFTCLRMRLWGQFTGLVVPEYVVKQFVEIIYLPRLDKVLPLVVIVN